MDDWEREELLIRMDERIKTIYNRMDKLAVIVTAAGGAGAMGMM